MVRHTFFCEHLALLVAELFVLVWSHLQLQQLNFEVSHAKQLAGSLAVLRTQPCRQC